MKVTNKELEILQILWNSGEPMNAKQICEDNSKMIMSTVQATLRKLLKKELIKVEDVVFSGTVLSRRYAPAITQEAFISMQYEKLSVANFVSYLLENDNDSDKNDELEEVMKLIEQKLEDNK